MKNIKTQLKELSECRRELEIEIPADEVSREFNTVLSNYALSAKIKGFRAGKAPRDLVKRMYEAQIRESLINSLAPKAISQELKAANIFPVDSPVINDIKYEEGGPLKLKTYFEVWPEFELMEYKKIKVKKTKMTVSAKEVNQSLEDLKEKSAQYEPIESRGVKIGDYVFAEIKGQDFHTKKFLPTEKIVILAGHPDNEMILNENLLGLKTNDDKNFEIKYPKDHKNKKLAEKSINYNLKVLSIKEKKLPEIDDEFAKDIGKFESLKDLKAEIKKQLKSAVDNRMQKELSAEILKKIADKVKFELPETIVQQETLTNLRQVLQMQQQPSVQKNELEKIQEEAKKKAERNIKNHLILNKIAEAEKLDVSEVEVTEELKSLAQANNMTFPSLREAMQREGRIEGVKQNIRLKKTVDFLVKHAIIE